MPTIYADENPPILHPDSPIDQIVGTWRVISCRYQREKKIAWELLDQSIPFFLPMFNNPLTGALKPLFPGYLFACTEEYFGFLSKHDHTFIPVPQQARLIQQLIIVKNAIDNDTIRPYGSWAHGQPCRVTKGPYMGFEAEVDRVDNKGRVFIDVETLGRVVEVEIDPEFLEQV